MDYTELIGRWENKQKILSSNGGVFMIIIDKKNYEKYLEDSGVDSSWKKRDFVSEVEKYMEDCSNRNGVIISGSTKDRTVDSSCNYASYNSYVFSRVLQNI